MVAMWKSLSDLFWTDSIWLAPGVKWADVTNGPEKKILYPDAKDLWYTLPLAVIFVILRYSLEKFCFKPFTWALGIKDKKNAVVPDIPLLESAFRISKQNKDVTALAKRLDISERHVDRWWRLRRNADKPSKLNKFNEHLWMIIVCGLNGLTGLYIMWDKEYFLNGKMCMRGYPHVGVTNDVWWYYMLHISYILSSIATLYKDVRRKDYVVIQVHHIATLVALIGAWVSSTYKFGALILPLMEGSECLLHVTKALQVVKFERTSNIVFISFLLTWLYARMYIYPVEILYRICQIPPEYQSFILYVVFTMLLVLMMLQIYWTVLIFQVAYRFTVSGVPRDVRDSSSEMSESCGENRVKGKETKNINVNGYRTKA